MAIRGLKVRAIETLQQLSAALLGEAGRGGLRAYIDANIGGGGSVGVSAPVLALEPLAPGPVYIINDLGVAKARQANGNSLAAAAMGFITASALAGELVTVYQQGVLSGLTGLTPGAVFLGAVSGTLVATPPTGVGQVAQNLGFAYSTTAMLFLPGLAFERAA